MYSLIVTAEEQAWDGRRYAMPSVRLGEFSPEGFKARYRTLEDKPRRELVSFATLFAYENPVGADARVGRVKKIHRSAGSEVRFEFELDPTIPPVSPKQLEELAWDLDIGQWEMTRTHWAIKDVDLLDVLEAAGLIAANGLGSAMARPDPTQLGRGGLEVVPTVFSIPDFGQEADLVALMLPFTAEFGPVTDAVRRACGSAGLRCQRVDDIWEESTIIQDVFNLIYRSRLVVVDLSDQNGNVLYETGIAHTLGRPVVPISQHIRTVPFDLAHHRTLVYHPNGEGLIELEHMLSRKLASLTGRHLARHRRSR